MMIIVLLTSHIEWCLSSNLENYLDIYKKKLDEGIYNEENFNENVIN
jgi:hypothetical protein